MVKGVQNGSPHNLHVGKVTGDVATALVLGDGLFPRRRIRISGFEVRGRRPAREEPDFDIAAGPLGDDDAAAVRVESLTVGLRILILDGAAGVCRLAGCVGVAVGGG